MKKCAIIICLYFISINNIDAQHYASDKYYTDSLTNLLQSATTDTAKANICFQLSYYWSSTDTAKAFYYVRKGTRLSNANNFYLAIAHFYNASIYFDFDVAKSQREYMLAEELLKAYNSPLAYQYRARLWHNYGALEQRKDNEKAFLNIILNKVIPFAQKANDSMRIALNFMDVGSIFMNELQYKKAIEYFINALNILRFNSNQYAELSNCYINTAKAFLLDTQYKPAKFFLDSAFYILSHNNEPSHMVNYFTTLGLYYNNIKNMTAPYSF